MQIGHPSQVLRSSLPPTQQYALLLEGLLRTPGQLWLFSPVMIVVCARMPWNRHARLIEERSMMDFDKEVTDGASIGLRVECSTLFENFGMLNLSSSKCGSHRYLYTLGSWFEACGLRPFCQQCSNQRNSVSSPRIIVDLSEPRNSYLHFR